MQNQYRSHLVNNLSPRRLIDVSIFTRQDDWLRLAERRSQRSTGSAKRWRHSSAERCIFCLIPFRSAHAQRVAHDYFSDRVLANYSVEFSEIQTLVLPVDSFESLRRNPERVRDGQTNPLRTNVQAENPRVRPALGLCSFVGHVEIISPSEKTKKRVTMQGWQPARLRPR